MVIGIICLENLETRNLSDDIGNFCDRIHNPQISNQIDAAAANVSLCPGPLLCRNWWNSK